MKLPENIYCVLQRVDDGPWELAYQVNTPGSDDEQYKSAYRLAQAKPGVTTCIVILQGGKLRYWLTPFYAEDSADPSEFFKAMAKAEGAATRYDRAVDVEQTARLLLQGFGLRNDAPEKLVELAFARAEAFHKKRSNP